MTQLSNPQAALFAALQHHGVYTRMSTPSEWTIKSTAADFLTWLNDQDPQPDPVPSITDQSIDLAIMRQQLRQNATGHEGTTGHKVHRNYNGRGDLTDWACTACDRHEALPQPTTDPVPADDVNPHETFAADHQAATGHHVTINRDPTGSATSWWCNGCADSTAHRATQAEHADTQ